MKTKKENNKRGHELLDHFEQTNEVILEENYKAVWRYSHGVS